MNRVKRKAWFRLLQVIFLSNAFNTIFFSAILSVLYFQTLRAFIQWANFICLFFTWYNSSFFVVAAYLFSYEVCGKSPLGPNPALLNPIGIIISALAKMGLNPLSSANKSCPQMSYLATQFLLLWTRVPLYIQSEDGMENAFPLTVTIKAPYYPKRKWQGRLHIYWQYLW